MRPSLTRVSLGTASVHGRSLIHTAASLAAAAGATTAPSPTTSSFSPPPSLQPQPFAPIPFDAVPRIPHKQNYHWQADTVHAWLYPLVPPTAHAATNGPAGMLALDRDVFGRTLRDDLVARGLRYEMSWLKQGTAGTQAKGQVRGSTAKARPQKGTGRSRISSRRAPHWRGGYVVHGPRPHDFAQDLPADVYAQAITDALSLKFAQQQLHVVDDLTRFPADAADPADAKRLLADLLARLGIPGKQCYLLHGGDEADAGAVLYAAAAQFTKRFPTPYGAFAGARPAIAVGGVDPAGLTAEARAELNAETMEVTGFEAPLMASSARHIALLPLMRHEHVLLDKRAVETLEEMYNRAAILRFAQANAKSHA